MKTKTIRVTVFKTESRDVHHGNKVIGNLKIEKLENIVLS